MVLFGDMYHGPKPCHSPLGGAAISRRSSLDGKKLGDVDTRNIKHAKEKRLGGKVSSCHADDSVGQLRSAQIEIPCGTSDHLRQAGARSRFFVMYSNSRTQRRSPFALYDLTWRAQRPDKAPKDTWQRARGGGSLFRGGLLVRDGTRQRNDKKTRDVNAPLGLTDIIKGGQKHSCE